MNRWNLRLFVAAAWLGLFPLAVNATPITYDFTVTATYGPLSGTTASGDFTYDSSSIVPGGSNVATGLLTGLDFTWDGIIYSAATANTGSLYFDASGGLASFIFGNQCFAGGCAILPAVESWSLTNSPPGFGAFLYQAPSFGIGGPGGGGGDATFSRAGAVSVSEPGTVSLLAAGLAGLGFSSRRKRKN